MKTMLPDFPPGTRRMLAEMAGSVWPPARGVADSVLRAARLELNRRPGPYWARGSLLLFARTLGRLAATYSGDLLADRVIRLFALWHSKGLAIEDLERVALVVWARLSGQAPPGREP